MTEIVAKLTLIWSDDPWDEDLIWCPSQLYKGFEVRYGFQTLLQARAYCRWRHSDPWTAEAIEVDGTRSSYVGWLTANLTAALHLPFYRDEEYKQLEAWVEKEFPAHAAEIVEQAIKAEKDSLASREQNWSRIKKELGIEW